MAWLRCRWSKLGRRSTVNPQRKWRWRHSDEADEVTLLRSFPFSDNHVFPFMDIIDDVTIFSFLIEERADGLSTDALRSSHRIAQTVYAPSEIQQVTRRGKKGRREEDEGKSRIREEQEQEQDRRGRRRRRRREGKRDWKFLETSKEVFSFSYVFSFSSAFWCGDVSERCSGASDAADVLSAPNRFAKYLSRWTERVSQNT